MLPHLTTIKLLPTCLGFPDPASEVRSSSRELVFLSGRPGRVCHLVKCPDPAAFLSAFSNSSAPACSLRRVSWRLWLMYTGWRSDVARMKISLWALCYVTLAFFKTTTLVFPFAAHTIWLGRNTCVCSQSSAELIKKKKERRIIKVMWLTDVCTTWVTVKQSPCHFGLVGVGKAMVCVCHSLLRAWWWDMIDEHFERGVGCHANLLQIGRVHGAASSSLL